jgi:hypothetical protein
MNPMDIYNGVMASAERGRQMGTGRRLADLVSQAYTAPRDQRQPVMGEIAKVGGLEALTGVQKAVGAADDDHHTQLAREAAMFTALPAEQRAQAYPKLAQRAREAGFPVPEDGWNESYMQGIEKLAGFAGGSAAGVHSGFIDREGRVMNRMRDGSVVWTGAYADPKTQLRDHPGMAPQVVDLRAGSASPLVAGGQAAAARPSEGQVAGEQAEARARVEAVYAPATAGAAENAKIRAQVANAPAVAGADAYAARLKAEEEARAKAGAESTERNRSNASAYRVYEQGLEGLKRGLGGADTGPLVGRLPAVTSGQQVAAGSVAAMAPVLKQLFRSSGEGVFTDKDQEMLIAMLPNRTDRPTARDEKLRNIDNIVRAKLGMSTPGGSKRQVKRTGTLNGRKVVQYTDGSVEYAN